MIKLEAELEFVLVMSTLIPLKIDARLSHTPLIVSPPWLPPVRVPWLIARFAPGVKVPRPSLPSAAMNSVEVATLVPVAEPIQKLPVRSPAEKLVAEKLVRVAF